MTGARDHGKSTFLWQAVLILLPVVVLAVIGWASLRQDKILAEHDARERAQAAADQLLPALWDKLVTWTGYESSNDIVFQIDDGGRLISPPPCDPTPTPEPFRLAELSPEQARLWTASQAGVTAAPAAIEDCRRFIDSKPPERFVAAAQYQLGVLLLQQRQWPDAEKSFSLVISQYPNAAGESGLPFLPLAQLKLIEHGHFPVGSFCSNIVYHPTLLTPFLLAQAQKSRPEVVSKWQRVWAEDERAREIFAAARGQIHVNTPLLSTGANKSEILFSTPRFFWFTLPANRSDWKAINAGGRAGIITDRNWIAARADGTNGNLLICRPEADIGLWIPTSTKYFPPYFAAEVEVAGKRIVEGAPTLTEWRNEYVEGGKGGGQFWKKSDSDKISTNLLASASRSENGAEQLKVNIYLTSPDELFASQQSRAMLFGLLVIASTAAALVGLVAAWRAFHRQLRLAEMKSNFVSSVSHELRAPIASVRLMAESLERGKVHEPQKQGEYFRFIVQECRRLSSLIENVLDFSRIEQGRKQYDFEPTDLLALTRETVKLMEPYAEEKGVRLELDSKLETVKTELELDGRAIQQALVNLIDNAIKHSPKGQIVTVGLDAGQRASGVPPDFGLPTAASNETTSGENNSDTPGMSVLLYVEDHGPGIPPHEQEKIFERFYRLGSELRRETQGVGIGLSIVRHIVEAHGGKVTVRSNVGQGSRFTIVLPVKTSETTDEHG
jgi:signal transduction histidine kinase/tetratricopeptide (TPR) repeat protein